MAGKSTHFTDLVSYVEYELNAQKSGPYFIVRSWKEPTLEEFHLYSRLYGLSLDDAIQEMVTSSIETQMGTQHPHVPERHHCSVIEGGYLQHAILHGKPYIFSPEESHLVVELRNSQERYTEMCQDTELRVYRRPEHVKPLFYRTYVNNLLTIKSINNTHNVTWKRIMVSMDRVQTAEKIQREVKRWLYGEEILCEIRKRRV